MSCLRLRNFPIPTSGSSRGALPEARSIQSTKQRLAKRDPLEAGLPQVSSPLARPRASARPAEPEGSRLMWPAIVAANLVLLGVIGAGIYWIMSDPNEAEVIEVTRERTAAKRTFERTTDPVSIDFESNLLASDAKEFESKFGKFKLGEGVRISEQDEGQRHLHLTGGEARQVVIEITQRVAFPVKLAMNAERVNRRDIYSRRYFLVEVSVDNNNWELVEPTLASPQIQTRELAGGPVSSRIEYIFENEAIRSVRLTANSKPVEGDPPGGGVFIGDMTLAPITDLSELNKPAF